MKLLIVDDNKDITYAVAEALRICDSSFDVMQANSAAQCLELLDRYIPDMIILDIMMPVMNGWELSFKLKGDPRANHIPIIYLTAIDDANCKKLGLLLGVDYIIKPFEIKQLHQAILKNKKKKDS
jgi:DNA-binding response OmpR family regulator